MDASVELDYVAAPTVTVTVGIHQMYSEGNHVSHLQRLGYILGTLLIGISTVIVVNNRRSSSSRQRNHRPVDELAQDLQQAWSVYHNR